MKNFLIISLVCITVGNSLLFTDLRGNAASLIEKGDQLDKSHVQKRIADQPRQIQLSLPKSVLRKINPNVQTLKRKRRNSASRSFRRRRARKYSDMSSSNSSSGSSSLELPKWKDQFKELWLEQKYEAMNSTMPPGDEVNMVAARPWGVPCGDPNQHDMPWGSCMLAIECEPEYRIYRGDFSCGRTRFVCCALQLNTYDMYQGFDVSFADSGLKTDSDEKRERDRSSNESKRRKRIRERRKRKRARIKRKRKIKRTIIKIVRMIKRILNRSYRNGTLARKRKTKQLKKYIKDLKRKYRKERKVIMDIHEIQLVKIDRKLMEKLIKIRQLNRNFMLNSTFREIITNGKINRPQARMLAEAYPELATDLVKVRRSGGDLDEPRDYLDYDIEYGLLYF